MNQKLYALKLTAAVAIAGVMHRRDSVVEVDEALAKNLLHRGKAVLATAEDAPPAPAATAPSPATAPTPAPAAKAPKGKK